MCVRCMQILRHFFEGIHRFWYPWGGVQEPRCRCRGLTTCWSMIYVLEVGIILWFLWMSVEWRCYLTDAVLKLVTMVEFLDLVSVFNLAIVEVVPYLLQSGKVHREKGRSKRNIFNVLGITCLLGCSHPELSILLQQDTTCSELCPTHPASWAPCAVSMSMQSVYFKFARPPATLG